MSRRSRACTSEGRNDQLVEATSASVGEVAACLVRVPTEVVKQRMQTANLADVAAQAEGAAGTQMSSSLGYAKHLLKTEGPRGFYQGFGSTVIRELPFSFIQMPLYELAKHELRRSFPGPDAGGEAAWHGGV